MPGCESKEREVLQQLEMSGIAAAAAGLLAILDGSAVTALLSL